MAFYAPPSSRLVDLLTQQGQERAALAQVRAGQLRQTFADIAQPVQAALAGLLQERREAPMRALQMAGAVQGLQEGQLKLGAEQERIARAKATQAVLGTPGVFNPQDGSIDLDKAATAAQAFGPVGMAILPELQQAELGRRKTAAESESAQATAEWNRSRANKKPEPKVVGPGGVLMSEDGSVVGSAPFKPETPKAVTFGAPQPYMLGGKRILARSGSDGQMYDMNGKTLIGSALAPDQPPVDTTPLSPAGIDIAALNFRKTGQLPALGMGDKVTRKQIIDRSATLTPEDIARLEAGGVDVAANKAGFTADSTTLSKLQQQRSAIGAFEQTALKNIDLFLEQAKKIPDTGSPLLNTPVRFVSGQVMGAAEQAAYNAARQVAVNEIAKITSNPTLAGQLSDSARREVEAFNPSNATLKQTMAVMRLLKQDMQNRTKALDAEMGTVRGRLSPGRQAPAKPTADPLGLFK
jgi:hypothetical protein